ncbi:hypothetical protein ACQP2F_21135 [Actinoplanes sp. CA-030573]|uniref:hypothetical protein n=1 Tax=Actinoplanes sp. CA-030573 TaxID=3239898 RepID=UPI003D8E3346
MPDPLTMTVLGGVAAAEGIKFLYGQAAELLKGWRERRAAGRHDELRVPIVPNDILDGEPADPVVDAGVVAREEKELARLWGALSPYALDLADIDLEDDELAEQAGKLRALLEAAYGQRFTFRGEQREPTGSKVTVRLALGDVYGQVVGFEGRIAGQIDVVENIKTVGKDGKVWGVRESEQ